MNQTIGNEVAAHTGYTGTLVRIDKHAKSYLVLLTNRVYPDDKAKVTPLRKSIITTMLEGQPIYEAIVEKEKEVQPAQ